MKLLQNKLFYVITSLVLLGVALTFELIGVIKPDILSDEYKANLFYYISIYDTNHYITSVAILYVVIFFITSLSTLFCLIFEFVKPSYSLGLKIISAILSFVALVFSIALVELRGITIFYALALSLYLILIALNVCFLINKEEPKPGKKKEMIINSIFSILSLLAVFVMLFIPYVQNPLTSIISYTSIFGILAVGGNLLTFVISMIYLLIFIMFAGFALSGLKYYVNNREIAYQRTRFIVYGGAVLTLAFYLTSVVLIEYFSSDGVVGLINGKISYIPFVISSIILIVYTFLSKDFELETTKHKVIDYKLHNVIAYIFIILFTALTYITLLGNIISVEISTYKTITINGYEVIKNYKELGEGYQLLAFFIFFVMLTSLILFISSTILFLRKSKLYSKLAIICIVTNYLFIFAIGLFGKYYEIAQKMNVDEISSIVSFYGYTVALDYKVKSYTMLFFFGASILMVLLLVLDPFNKRELDEVKVSFDKKEKLEGGSGEATSKLTTTKPVDFDSCPAFSEIDSNKEAYDIENHDRLNHRFNYLTLPKLVEFVVEYARDSRLHLSYSKEDIAQFVAGLGATKLSILQGMSGTGKTSLPKIFIEALMGNCEIVEVESSWKDKNELIGYYNEFSKTFTPKKFTQALYRAKLNENNIYFIVLDEMNLSRIEYYFSDFLSLMENEEDKREIKLLNVKLYRYLDEQEYEYLGLTDGHTIKIPKNVWFIGTANRDESTFEISDKVYDRANTINFNKRAPKITSFNSPKEPLYVSYSEFRRILDDAKEGVKFDIEAHKIFADVEEILAPFNISFGNRIAKQIEEFVKVYCSCFDDPAANINDAIERILLSKVVSKLEYRSVEDKEILVKKFTKLGLKNCANFVSKLNEDF